MAAFQGAPVPGVTAAVQQLIEDRFYNSNSQFTSAKFIYRDLKRDPAVNPKPTYRQVRAALAAQTVKQTLEPNRVHSFDYDSISSKYRAPGRPIHSCQCDLMIMTQQEAQNKIGAAKFVAIMIFLDVWSRYIIAWPLTGKAAPKILEAVQHAWNEFGGWENLTSDSESGLNSILVRTWLATQDVGTAANPKAPRLWLSAKDNKERGTGATTYMVERAIKDLRYLQNAYFRTHNTRTWAFPTPKPPGTTLATLKANNYAESPFTGWVKAKNGRFHSALGTSPRDVFVNDTKPLYQANFETHGVCRAGQECKGVVPANATEKEKRKAAAEAKRGVRIRDTSQLFKVGDRVRIAKLFRIGIDKRSTVKSFSINIFEIINDDYPSGRSNFNQGYPQHGREDALTKQGQSRRFLVQNVLKPDDVREMLYYMMRKIEPGETRVFDPTTKATRPIDITTATGQGKSGEQFTQGARAEGRADRAFAKEDIGARPAAAADSAGPARGTRSGGRPRPPAGAAPKPKRGGKAPAPRFVVGDRVSVKWLLDRGETENFQGEITAIDGTTLTVDYDVGGIEDVDFTEALVRRLPRK